MADIKKYDSDFKPTWCPGCGAFGIFNSLKTVFDQQGWGLDDVCLTYDIGCSSNMANFIKVYGLGGLHGRSLPAACGVSLAHHQMPVIAIAGDGGAYGEGLNHFMAACRANYNLTYVVINNQIYALTTGQTSPTTAQGQKTKSTPFGAIEKPFNPLTAAIENEAGFVSRSYAANPQHMIKVLTAAIKHNGFALVDILSPCVTWQKKDQPFSWYHDRVYELEKKPYSKEEALEIARQEPEKLPIGIFYTNDRPSYQDKLPQLKNEPLVHQSIKTTDISPCLEEFL